MFSRNAFLVDIVSERIGQVLKLDSIEGGRIWKGNDILIFNSWHWWLHTGKKQMYIKFPSSHNILTLHASCLMLIPLFLYYTLQMGFHSGRKTYIQRHESFGYVQESFKNMGQMG
jgi:hypothetical protein